MSGTRQSGRKRGQPRQATLQRFEAALDRLEGAGDGDRRVSTGDDVLKELVGRLETTVEQVEGRNIEIDTRSVGLMAALSQVPEGVVIADAGGAVVYRNDQAAALVGARHGEALAERAVAKLLAAAAAGGEHEETLELFSLPRRTLTIRAQSYTDGETTAGAVAIIEDVSERRRLEAVRRDFVANISHELKTPVGALSLVAETLEGEDDPAVIARLAHRMSAEAERLGRIIEDLLDLSRIEAEESPTRNPVGVHLIINQALDRLRPTAEHRGIALEVSESRDDLFVRGDRRQLVSAIYNLVDNAIKYSDDDSAVQVTAQSDNALLEIRVVDHGVGIPTRDLERIFERFYRVDRARSRDTGGTGLGLAIVRHVAANHGGHIDVDSREGEGSTFTLRLPDGTATLLAGTTTRETKRG